MNRGLLILVLVATLLGSGCFSADFSTEKREIERRTGLSLESETSIHVGRMLMGMARAFVDNEDDAELNALLRACRGVDVRLIRSRLRNPIDRPHELAARWKSTPGCGRTTTRDGSDELE